MPDLLPAFSSVELVARTTQTATARLHTNVSPPPPYPPPPLPTPLTKTPPEETTILYITTIHELRPSTLTYNFSIDRVYHSLSQANTRLLYLARCNTAPRETLHAGSDGLTNCHWITWTSPNYPRQPRFHGVVNRLLLQGPLLTTSDCLPQEREHASPYASLTAFSTPHSKDLTHTIWAIATHQPSDRLVLHPRTSQPLNLPWNLTAVHPVSGNALAAAKFLWKRDFSPIHGSAHRTEAHYGAARYIFAPMLDVLAVGGTVKPLEGVQIRVERIEVVPPGEMPATALPAEAIRYEKPWRPLCPGRELGAGIEDELDEIFLGLDLSPDEEVEAVEERLKRRYVVGAGRENAGNVDEDDLGLVLRPGDTPEEVCEGRVVEKAPVKHRGVKEKAGRKMKGWLYHVFLE